MLQFFWKSTSIQKSRIYCRAYPYPIDKPDEIISNTEKVKEAYYYEANKNNMTLIPCGDVIQELRKMEPFLYGHGGMSICRDGFHMNVIYGRYLLAAMWYRIITNNKICTNTYVPHTELAPNAICDMNVLNVIKNIVDNDEFWKGNV